MALMRISLFPLLCLSFLSTGYAAQYHVSKTGNDGNPGSTDRPFNTIQRCAAAGQAGDTCLIQPGNYSERVTPTTPGAPGRLITFKAQGRVVMKGFTLRSGYVRVEGFEITETANVWPERFGIYLKGDGYEVVHNFIHNTAGPGVRFYHQPPFANRSLVDGNVIRYAEGQGIAVYGEDNIVQNNDISHTLNATGGDADGIRFFGNGHIFRSNTIHDITEAEAPGAHTDAFQTFDNDRPPTTNILIEGNYCYNLDHQMIIITAATKRKSSNITIRNNVFKSPANAPNWQLFYILQTPNIEIVHNTFINARHRAVYAGDRATNLTLKNNLFYDVPRYYEIEDNSKRGFDVGSNLHFPSANPPSEINGIYADPQFVDSDAGDFRLRATSPAIDRAENLGISTDFKRQNRPFGDAPDIGAHEFVDKSIPGGPSSPGPCGENASKQAKPIDRRERYPNRRKVNLGVVMK